MPHVSSTPIAYYNYGARGNVSQSGDYPQVGEMLYTGHYYHRPSGLYLALFRAYNPETGKWLSRDPIGQERGLIYMDGNNPLSLIDILGLDWIESTGQQISLYGGTYGDYSNLKKNCRASSGMSRHQDTGLISEEGGPIPPGQYLIDLGPNPNRIAKNYPNALGANEGRGISQIPDGENSDCGSWRAQLEPVNGKNTYGRTNFYLHNSHKRIFAWAH